MIKVLYKTIEVKDELASLRKDWVLEVKVQVVAREAVMYIPLGRSANTGFKSQPQFNCPRMNLLANYD